MPDQAALAELRQANAHYADGYNQRLAVELFALLPHDRQQALRVLAYVDAIMNLELPPPSGDVA